MNFRRSAFATESDASTRASRARGCTYHLSWSFHTCCGKESTTSLISLIRSASRLFPSLVCAPQPARTWVLSSTPTGSSALTYFRGRGITEISRDKPIRVLSLGLQRTRVRRRGCQAPLDDSGCAGARMVEAERVSGQPDGSVTKDARMKPSARATGMLCASGRAYRAFRWAGTPCRISANARCGGRDARGPKADARGGRSDANARRNGRYAARRTSGALVWRVGRALRLGHAVFAESSAVALFLTTRDEPGGCAAQTAARGVEGEARARDEQVGIAYARAEALRSRVDVGRARRRSARTSALVEYANETRARGNAQLYPNQSHDGVFFLATFTRTRLPVVRSTS